MFKRIRISDNSDIWYPFPILIGWLKYGWTQITNTWAHLKKNRRMDQDWLDRASSHDQSVGRGNREGRRRHIRTIGLVLGVVACGCIVVGFGWTCRRAAVCFINFLLRLPDSSIVSSGGCLHLLNLIAVWSSRPAAGGCLQASGHTHARPAAAREGTSVS